MPTNNAKRNEIPESVSVMDLNDLAAFASLNAKEDAMVENRYTVFIHNLEHLLNKMNFSQARLCRELLHGHPQPPQIASYKNIGRDIPFRTIVRIAVACGYTPEMLLCQLLDQVDDNGVSINKIPPRPMDEYNKYLGTYNLAYFATDTKLGSNKRSTARAMACGVMSVFFGKSTNGNPTLDVLALINCTDDEQEMLLNTIQTADCNNNGRVIRQCYESIAAAKTDTASHSKSLYEGHMTLSDGIAEIDLHQTDSADTIHMHFHNRAAVSSKGREYQGGLATMMSISRGAEHMPCIQAVIMSKRKFSIAKEELANYLFLEPPQVNLQEETKTIVSYMKTLFPGEGTDSPLSQFSEADRASMLESFIDKKLTEVVQRNILSYYKISTEMDSDMYKAVCRDQ